MRAGVSESGERFRGALLRSEEEGVIWTGPPRDLRAEAETDASRALDLFEEGAKVAPAIAVLREVCERVGGGVNLSLV